MAQSANNITAIDSGSIGNDLSNSTEVTTADLYLDLSVLLKAVADPLRLEILRVLAKNSYGVLELAFLFDLKQSAMSHHLKVLANAQLVTTRREGNSIFYRRNQPLIDAFSLHNDNAGSQESFLVALFKTLDGLPLKTEIKQRLDSIQLERATASQEFFASNANKFKEQQDLIASYSVYGDHVQDLLDHVNFIDENIALEIGPGEGEFLSVLIKQFKHVIALDNSIEMLNKAKQLSSEQKNNGIEFILGDTKTAIEKKIIADCIIINMVLHHVPSPEELFQDAAALLNQNGSLLVTDLCRHDQQWATDSCGDLWLGFEPTEFSTWAHDAGLTEGQSQFFALRNGFQIQLRHFYKGKINT
ncbi:MAG: metalloregulator ArsR/SmtB family transcription factor [Cellvibrionaceae bacterium]